ncbi:hypothetical protein [Zunongwangia sp.]|uniref:hypothetical protein n=1 Tax=Zunongwangia sp. TaxID=1965325 RepID=UPI003AA99503
MKKLVCFCFAILMFSCNSAKKLQNINSSLIAEGNLYGNGAEGLSEKNRVLKNQKEWKDLVAKMNTVNAAIEEDQVNSVDFDKQIVIALIDKQRNKGGYSIKISTIENKKESVVIKMKKFQTEGMATMGMMQPYYLATIPKTNKEIIFEEVK